MPTGLSRSIGPELARLASATIKIPYPWVQGEAHTIMLVTSTGALFEAVIPVAVNTPTIDLRAFLNFALIGIYIGIIPVGLGLMWQPFMRGLRRRTHGCDSRHDVGSAGVLVDRHGERRAGKSRCGARLAAGPDPVRGERAAGLPADSSRLRTAGRKSQRSRRTFQCRMDVGDWHRPAQSCRRD